MGAPGPTRPRCPSLPPLSTSTQVLSGSPAAPCGQEARFPTSSQKEITLTKLFAVGTKVHGGDRSFVALKISLQSGVLLGRKVVKCCKQVQTSDAGVPGSARSPPPEPGLGTATLAASLRGRGALREHTPGPLPGDAKRRLPAQNPQNPPWALPRIRRARGAPWATYLNARSRAPAAGSESQVRGGAPASVLFKNLPGDSDAGAPRKPSENSGGHRAAPARSGAPGRGEKRPGSGQKSAPVAESETWTPRGEGRGARG